ncbi:ras-domain-containing protein [Laetiporus sulphureus 93-53]|uniref:Ras-domain-containing protein n=1 Tax=Laetiporus sulphureus 93-53 TaxID=1314785 RepID=A0A165E117_9APHY|nr:ras-domain-containing protein [Laetiporus sulphureus 93-53]KZT06043.1 ras-domain-containing protein [Laetiporus sulphureus 93-53]
MQNMTATAGDGKEQKKMIDLPEDNVMGINDGLSNLLMNACCLFTSVAPPSCVYSSSSGFAAMSRAQFLREYKMVVVGDGGVGKSALTIQFIQNQFMTEYDPTIEDSYRKRYVIDEELAVLDVLDTAGQEEYRTIREQYMRSGEGFLLVYSITSRRSFEALATFHQQIVRVKDQEVLPIVIVANKSDLEYERQVGMNGRSIAKNLDCKFIETSARQRVNVDEAFCTLVREIRKHNKEQQASWPVQPSTPSIPGAHDAPKGESHVPGCRGGCIVA